MADNLRNPLKGAETDMTKATSAISGLLNPSEEETIGQTEPPKQETQFQIMKTNKQCNVLRINE